MAARTVQISGSGSTATVGSRGAIFYVGDQNKLTEDVANLKWDDATLTLTANKLNVGTLILNAFAAIDGSAVAPSYSFINAPGMGLYKNNAALGIAVGGAFVGGIDAGGKLSIGVLDLGYNNDSFLLRDAANTLAQRNGVNAQNINLYKTFTDSGNYERLIITTGQGVSGGAFIGWGAGGTGVNRPIEFGVGSQSWQITTNNHFIAINDNVNDIGASGANRPRTGYFGTNVITGNLGLGGNGKAVFLSDIGDSNWRIGYELTPTGAQLLTTAAVVHTVYGGSANYGFMVRNSSNLSLLEIHGVDGTARFGLGTARQFQIAPTASAVNYMQVTGAATTLTPALSMQGADTNVGLTLTLKGNAALTVINSGPTAVQDIANFTNNGDMDFHIRITGTGAATPTGTIGPLVARNWSLGTAGGNQVDILHVASTNRTITLAGSNGGNPTIDVSAGALKLSAGTSDIQWGKANVALGGGAAPTLGTIGGTGPAAAAQRNWMRFLESDGIASFIPVWR